MFFFVPSFFWQVLMCYVTTTFGRFNLSDFN